MRRPVPPPNHQPVLLRRQVCSTTPGCPAKVSIAKYMFSLISAGYLAGNGHARSHPFVERNHRCCARTAAASPSRICRRRTRGTASIRPRSCCQTLQLIEAGMHGIVDLAVELDLLLGHLRAVRAAAPVQRTKSMKKSPDGTHRVDVHDFQVALTDQLVGGPGIGARVAARRDDTVS